MTHADELSARTHERSALPFCSLDRRASAHRHERLGDSFSRARHERLIRDRRRGDRLLRSRAGLRGTSNRSRHRPTWPAHHAACLRSAISQRALRPAHRCRCRRTGGCRAQLRCGGRGKLSTDHGLHAHLFATTHGRWPLLVALFVALASPRAAVGFAAGSGFIGVFLFLRSPVLRNWKIEPRGHATLLGPLAERSFVALIAVVLCYALAFGLTEIGVAAYAAQAGQPALAGVFLGLMSARSAPGRLAYGSPRPHAPLLRQFGALLPVIGLGLLPLALPWSLWSFAVFSTIGGVAKAPPPFLPS